MDFPQEYQNREKVDPLTLFQAPTVKKESKPEVNFLSFFLWDFENNSREE